MVIGLCRMALLGDDGAIDGVERRDIDEWWRERWRWRMRDEEAWVGSHWTQKEGQRSNQRDGLERWEHRQKLREFRLVTFLPLRLVTRDISLLDLIVLGRSGGPMPLRWWFCFWEERKYESLCCRGFYVKYKTTDFGLWGVLCVFRVDRSCICRGSACWFGSCSVRSHLEAWEQIVCCIVPLLCECSWALCLSRACLKGLVGVRILCVYLDLP
jgi:hypothetical protein